MPLRRPSNGQLDHRAMLFTSYVFFLLTFESFTLLVKGAELAWKELLPFTGQTGSRFDVVGALRTPNALCVEKGP